MSFLQRGLSLSQTRLGDTGMCLKKYVGLVILAITSVNYFSLIKLSTKKQKNKKKLSTKRSMSFYLVCHFTSSH